MNRHTKNFGAKTSKLDTQGQHWRKDTERRETKKTPKISKKMKNIGLTKKGAVNPGARDG